MPTSSTTRIGDVAEFLFDAKAVENGFIVNRPIHAGTVYDRVVDSGKKFFKVQIKCVTKEMKTGGYNVILLRGRQNKTTYEKNEVDVFAIYILPENDWYIFKNEGQRGIYIYKGSFKKYKNNWNQFYEKI